MSVFSKNLIQKGFAKGYLKAMIELVEDNTITIEEAAEKVGMDIGSFENEMKKYQLHCYMDEVSTPYEENENPYPRTKEDDAFEHKMIEKYNLVLAEETDEEWKKQECRKGDFMNYVKEKFYIVLEDEDVIKSHGYTYEDVYNDLQRVMNNFYVPCVKDGDYYYFKQTEEQLKCFAMDSIYFSLASLKSLAGNIKILRYERMDEIYEEESEEEDDYLDALMDSWQFNGFL